MTSTLLTILPGQDGGGVDAVLPRTTTCNGAESAAPGQAAATRTASRQASPSATAARDPPARLSAAPCTISSCKPRPFARVAAPILPSGSGKCGARANLARSRPRGHCRVAPRNGGHRPRRGFRPGRPCLVRDRGRRDRARGRQRGPPDVLPRDPRPDLARPRRPRARAQSPPLPAAGACVSALDLSLRAQAAAIATGEVGSAELLEATLARIEERNPAINAVVETFPERSREMLAGAPKGPLHGVPVVIKDEWPLPWRAQRFGAAELLEPTAPGESGPYRAMRDAGAVVVGVGNMHELGAGSTGNVSVYGAARNPWDTERCP